MNIHLRFPSHSKLRQPITYTVSLPTVVWLCVCLYAREHTFVKSRLPFPWAAKKRTVREVTVRGGKNKEWRADHMFCFCFLTGGELAGLGKTKPKKDLRGGLLLAKWKQASAKQITSQKPKMIRWDKLGWCTETTENGRARHSERWTYREMKDSIWCGSSSKSIFISNPIFVWALAEMGGRKGGAADQKDQSQLKLRIKTKLLL